jgi:hypothetical protein
MYVSSAMEAMVGTFLAVDSPDPGSTGLQTRRIPRQRAQIGHGGVSTDDDKGLKKQCCICYYYMCIFFVLCVQSATMFSMHMIHRDCSSVTYVFL